ncbi:sorting nexin-29 isoform X2 [Zootermopsis nevadensis]|uniref:Sorting nexin-29 n=1 Tax=Zootermopsis nevadensis TaxID=136037 RepID=A0A067RTJ3_ZOONE|nr:sorting nexin-29 isoform X2 [Zootermopsis nevadensis]KDR23144.1 Sorting nexin-29 [Zootermopsis nevadensis]
MMSALVLDASSGTTRAEERQRLLSELLEAVKQCQIRFGGRAELATESHPRVAVLCNRIEAALCHGLRSKPLLLKNSSAFRQVTEIVSSSLHLGRGPAQDHQVLWHYVREHLTRHEYERYLVLKHVWTDLGRGRAWLRSSLNEHSLERYLHCMLGSTAHLSIFFEDWAFLLDQERSSMLPTMAAGLGSILFAISIDNADLNQLSHAHCDVEPLVPSLMRSEPVIAASDPDTSCKWKLDRRRKRVPAHIISFDEDTLAEQHLGTQVVSSSAPPTCLNSPASGLGNMLMPAETVGTFPTEPADGIAGSNVTVSGGQAQNASLPHDGSMTESKSPRPDSLPVLDSEQPSELQLSYSPQQSRRSSTRNLSRGTGRNKDTQGPGMSSMVNAMCSVQTLTPVNNVSVGELIPVSVTDEAHSEEDSLSVPSYSEDTDCAAAALLATQKLLQTNCVEFSPQEFSTTGNCCNVTDPFTHVNSEVREAVMSLLARKEELQAETRSIKRLLDQAQEQNAELKAELAETNRQHQDKIDRLESQIQGLVRENELLKHQLRKYVGAVQMLKRDGTQAHEALASLEACQPKSGDVSYPDYHHEAREYEKKLIQVAEMHGELMEFNDRLHRLLQQKDAALRRLREELVDLRGPLPDDVATSDDDLSVTSDYDTGSLCAAARALVNIWIPSAFLTGGSSDVHHVYQVYIRIRDDEWNVYRRYAQFYSLHKELKKYDAIVSTFDFPPKKTLGNKDAKFVEERRRRLQHYLRCVMNHLVQTNVDLATAPDKELLIGLVPFFGEMCNTVDDRSRRKRPNSRNPFSRLAHGGVESNQTVEHSPQYTGL